LACKRAESSRGIAILAAHEVNDRPCISLKDQIIVFFSYISVPGISNREGHLKMRYRQKEFIVTSEYLLPTNFVVYYSSNKNKLNILQDASANLGVELLVAPQGIRNLSAHLVNSSVNIINTTLEVFSRLCATPTNRSVRPSVRTEQLENRLKEFS
jgi:hypothetical protein